MSHIVSIQTRIRDPDALKRACQRLGLAEPTCGTATIFTTQASGWIVQLPGWHYPAVIDLATGQIAYDTYNGNWGNEAELSRLLQAYACEKAKLEARRQGHSVQEQTLPDGSIKLTLQVGGEP